MSWPDVLQIEALRQDVVELHRSELPLAADAVADDEVDLGSVECGLAGVLDKVGEARISSRTASISCSARCQIVAVGTLKFGIGGVVLGEPDLVVGQAQAS